MADIFERMKAGELILDSDPEYPRLYEALLRGMRITGELNSSYRTPAEVRAARVLGADAVGMSTVPEAIAAAHCGYEILGVTLCANMAAGVLPQPLSGEEVNEMAEQSAPHFSSLILGCLERL